MVNKLFDCGKHAQSKNKHWKLLLILFSRMFTICKEDNDVVYDVNHIVDDVVMINDSVNCLFAICKLSIWILASWMMLLRLFATWLMMLICWWDCLQDDRCCWYCIQFVWILLRLLDVIYQLQRSCLNVC